MPVPVHHSTEVAEVLMADPILWHGAGSRHMHFVLLHLAAGGGEELGAVGEHQGGHTAGKMGHKKPKLPISIGNSEHGAARTPQSSTRYLLDRTGMGP